MILTTAGKKQILNSIISNGNVMEMVGSVRFQIIETKKNSVVVHIDFVRDGEIVGDFELGQYGINRGDILYINDVSVKIKVE